MCSGPEVPGISMMSPFSTDLPVTAQRHAISFVLVELNSLTCSPAISAKTKSAGNFILDAQGAAGLGRREDPFWMLAKDRDRKKRHPRWDVGVPKMCSFLSSRQ